MGGPWANAAKRSDVDDSAMAAAKFMSTCLRHEKRTANIHGKHLIPLLDRNLAEASSLIRTRVVDEQVELPKLVYRLSRTVGDRLCVAQIAAHSDAVHTESINLGRGFDRFLR